MCTKLKMIEMALFAMLWMPSCGQSQALNELMEQGEQYFKQQDYSKAIDCFRRAAEQGDAWGQDDYGCMFLYGTGVERDYKTALEWFKKSADQGFAEGQYDLGRMYHYGLGVEQDYAKALEWYNKAAQ